MAIKLDLPLFQDSTQLVEEDGTPTYVFHRWWQSVVVKVQEAITALEDVVLSVQAAVDAAGIAQAAADNAQAAADNANAAAADAQTAVDAVEGTSKLSGSGVDGLTVTATDAGADATIDLSAHDRVYSDSTVVSVNAGSLTGLIYSTTYYIYYDDPTFAGGAVTYEVTTVKSVAAQTNGRHLVGQVTTPASGAGPSDGLTPEVPGFGSLA